MFITIFLVRCQGGEKLIIFGTFNSCMVDKKEVVESFTDELENREEWVKSAEESQHNDLDEEPHRVFVHCLSDYCNEVNVPEVLEMPDVDSEAIITNSEGSHDAGYMIVEFKTE